MIKAGEYGSNADVVIAVEALMELCDADAADMNWKRLSEFARAMSSQPALSNSEIMAKARLLEKLLPDNGEDMDCNLARSLCADLAVWFMGPQAR